MKELVSYRNRLEVRRLSLTPQNKRVSNNSKTRLSLLLEKSDKKSPHSRNLSVFDFSATQPFDKAQYFSSAQKISRDNYKETKSVMQSPGIQIEENISDGPPLSNSNDSPRLPSIEFKDIAIKDSEELLKSSQDSSSKIVENESPARLAIDTIKQQPKKRVKPKIQVTVPKKYQNKPSNAPSSKGQPGGIQQPLSSIIEDQKLENADPSPYIAQREEKVSFKAKSAPEYFQEKPKAQNDTKNTQKTKKIKINVKAPSRYLQKGQINNQEESKKDESPSKLQTNKSDSYIQSSQVLNQRDHKERKQHLIIQEQQDSNSSKQGSDTQETNLPIKVKKLDEIEDLNDLDDFLLEDQDQQSTSKIQEPKQNVEKLDQIGDLNDLDDFLLGDDEPNSQSQAQQPQENIERSHIVKLDNINQLIEVLLGEQCQFKAGMTQFKIDKLILEQAQIQLRNNQKVKIDRQLQVDALELNAVSYCSKQNPSQYITPRLVPYSSIEETKEETQDAAVLKKDSLNSINSGKQGKPKAKAGLKGLKICIGKVDMGKYKNTAANTFLTPSLTEEKETPLVVENSSVLDLESVNQMTRMMEKSQSTDKNELQDEKINQKDDIEIQRQINNNQEMLDQRSNQNQNKDPEQPKSQHCSDSQLAMTLGNILDAAEDLLDENQAETLLQQSPTIVKKEDSQERTSLPNGLDNHQMSVLESMFEQNTQFAKARTKSVMVGKNKQVENKAQMMREFDFYKKQFEENQKRQRSQLDFGLLFSSPSYLKIQGTDSTALEPINYKQEVKIIKEVARESGKNIKFMSSVATQQHFVDIIKKQPTILHISCHGIFDEQRYQRDPSTSQEDLDYLVFEDTEGQAQLVSAKQLKKLIKKNLPSLDLVFVAACQSEIVGQIFNYCGAKHVICVDKQYSLLDEAAASFTREFYKSILNGYQICEAYESAKLFVASIHGEGEADFLKLFLSEDLEVRLSKGLKKRAPHVCYSFPKKQEGKLHCLSDHNHLKMIPQIDKALKYREKLMAKILQGINQGQRLTLLYGLSGIGKSFLAKHIMWHLAERKVFQGGLMMFNLKGIRSCNSLFQVMKKEMVRRLHLNQLKEECPLNEEFENYFQQLLIRFFLQKEEGMKLENRDNESKNFKKGKETKFMVCFDNAEEIITQDRSHFKNFVTLILQSCPLVSFMVTTLKPIGEIPDWNQIYFELVPSLKTKEAVQLFVDNAADIFPEEIVKFVESNPFGPMRILFKSEEIASDGKLTERQLQLIQQSCFGGFMMQFLQYHDLFRQLSGNPQSICMLAAFHKNHSVTNNDLSSIYAKIMKEKNEEQQEDTQSNSQKGGSKINRQGNQMSLRISTEATVALLEETSKQSLNLLYFLGCFPVGVHKSQLQEMWNENVVEDLKLLNELMLVEKVQSKYCLTDFLSKWVNDSMLTISKDSFMSKLINYYCIQIRDMYGIICRKDTDVSNKEDLCNDDTIGGNLQTKNSEFFQMDETNEESNNNLLLDDGGGDQNDEESEALIQTQASFNSDVLKKLTAQVQNFQSKSVDSGSKKGNGNQDSPLKVEKAEHQTEEMDKKKARLEIFLEDIANFDNVIQYLIDQAGVPRKNSSFIWANNDQNVQKSDEAKNLMTIDNQFLQSNQNSKQIIGEELYPQLKKASSMQQQNYQRNTSLDIDFGHNSKSLFENSVNSADSDAGDSSIATPKFFKRNSIQSINGFRFSECVTLDAVKEEDENSNVTLGSINETSSSGSGVSSNEDQRRLNEFNKMNSGDLKEYFKVEHQASTSDKSRLTEKMFEKNLKEFNNYQIQRRQALIAVEFSDSSYSSSSSGSDSQSESEELDEEIQKSLLDLQSIMEVQASMKMVNQRVSIQQFRKERASPVDLLKLKPRISDVKSEMKFGSMMQKSKMTLPLSKSAKFSGTKSTGRAKYQKLMTSVNSNNTSGGSSFDDIRTTNLKNSNSVRNQSIKTKLLEKQQKKLAELDKESEYKLVRKQRFIGLNTEKKKQPPITPDDFDFTATRSASVSEANEKHSSLKMSGRGHFLIYSIASLFLADQLERCLKLCQVNFSCIENSILFEGNLLRFQALALQRIFEKLEEKQKKLDIESLEEKIERGYYNNIFEAVVCLQNAFEIFSVSMNSLRITEPQNKYGMALCQFQLGQLFLKYPQVLSKSSKTSEKTTVQDCQSKAFNFFQQAAISFHCLNHLKGMQLSKKGQIQSYKAQKESNDVTQHTDLVLREKELTDQINVYVKEHGFESSCFRLREHGDELSLMSEIVLFNSQVNLFPQEFTLQQELREMYETLEGDGDGIMQARAHSGTILSKQRSTIAEKINFSKFMDNQLLD